MPRSIRLESQEACYHVSNHGISQLSVFEAQADTDGFFELLNDVHHMFKVEIYAYVLMNESYHLLMRTPQANLSSVMRYINSVYTQRYNRSKCRKGPLFCGRYKSILINLDMYLIQVSRYLHWLPVQLDYCKWPADYSRSSCKTYYGNTAKPIWLSSQAVLRRFGTVDPHSKYKAYIERGVDKEMLNFYERKHASKVLGPSSFKHQLSLNSSLPKSRITDSTAQWLNKLSIPDIVEYVEGQHGKSKLNADTYDNESRNIAMALCREIGGHSLKEIANAFKVGHHRSVSVIVSRTKKKLDTDPGLSDYYHSIRDRLLLEGC